MELIKAEDVKPYDSIREALDRDPIRVLEITRGNHEMVFFVYERDGVTRSTEGIPAKSNVLLVERPVDESCGIALGGDARSRGECWDQ